MIMTFLKKKSIPTDLSWDEKNPKVYVSKPSAAIRRLKKEFTME